jgi:hypothetical protein
MKKAIQFLTLKSDDNNPCILEQKPYDEVTGPLIHRYYKKMVGRTYTATQKYHTVEYNIFSYKNGVMKICIKRAKAGNQQLRKPNSLNKMMIQLMVDDHILQLTKQYFNEYAQPKSKIFYTQEKAGVFNYKTVL